MSDFQYQPGVCNIDDYGVKWRRNLGIVCTVAGVVSLFVAYSEHFPMWSRCTIGAGFTFGAALNFLQSQGRFCAINASRGVFEQQGKHTKIASELGRREDKKRRNKMMVQSLIAAAAGAMLGLLPI